MNKIVRSSKHMFHDCNLTANKITGIWHIKAIVNWEQRQSDESCQVGAKSSKQHFSAIAATSPSRTVMSINTMNAKKFRDRRHKICRQPWKKCLREMPSQTFVSSRRAVKKCRFGGLTRVFIELQQLNPENVIKFPTHNSLFHPLKPQAECVINNPLRDPIVEIDNPSD